jgi:hypothetical protein
MRQRTVPQGRLKMTQDAILGYFYLRDELFAFGAANPGLTSWAILSRPFGTQFRKVVLTQTAKVVFIVDKIASRFASHIDNLNPGAAG